MGLAGPLRHTWRLPPERWHDFGNSIQAQFQFDYWAVGPGAANLNIGIEQSPVRTLDDDAWTYLVSPGQIPLARLDDAASRIVGENGSVFDAYPMCGTLGGLLGGRVWNPKAPPELQSNGMFGRPDYQTWQGTSKIGSAVKSQDGGLLVQHWADSVPGMSGAPFVKVIDNEMFAIGCHMGGTKSSNFFVSGPALIFGALFAHFWAYSETQK